MSAKLNLYFKHCYEFLKLNLPSTDYPTVGTTAPTQMLDNTMCLRVWFWYVCVFVCVRHLLRDLYHQMLPYFCGPSQYTGNQLCGYVMIVFTTFAFVWDFEGLWATLLLLTQSSLIKSHHCSLFITVIRFPLSALVEFTQRGDEQVPSASALLEVM